MITVITREATLLESRLWLSMIQSSLGCYVKSSGIMLIMTVTWIHSLEPKPVLTFSNCLYMLLSTNIYWWRISLFTFVCRYNIAVPHPVPHSRLNQFFFHLRWGKGTDYFLLFLFCKTISFPFVFKDHFVLLISETILNYCM